MNQKPRSQVRQRATAGLLMMWMAPQQAFAAPPVAALPARQYSVLDTSERPSVTVRVLGQVQQPGIYQVPLGTPAADVVAYAGGPGEYAEDTVTLTRGEVTVDRFAMQNMGTVGVQAGDTIFIAPSWRRDLPLYIQITTAVVSILTLGIVVSNSQK